MPAPSSATRPSPELPPYSRSRGGRGAGSSVRPGRRNPPGSGGRGRRRLSSAGTRRSAIAPPVAFVDAARRELVRQRAFRTGQLDELEAVHPDAATDEARREVHVAVLAAARVALADIDAALHRIERGRYGRCHRCGDPLTMERLSALPMSASCGPCVRLDG